MNAVNNPATDVAGSPVKLMPGTAGFILEFVMSKKIKELKELELNDLRSRFKGVKDYVILEPLKVDAGTEHEFRKKLRDKKCTVRLVKNTLARKVFIENGIDVDVWSGPTMLIWGGESIKDLANSVDTAIKELKKDPKAPDKFKEKTAVADGEAVTLEVAKKLPTRKEAIGGALAALLGPAGQLVGCLTGPASQLAGLVKAIEDKGEATPVAAESTAPAAAEPATAG